MKIIIKDTKNKRTVIEINENDKIKDLKNKIKETLRMNNSNFYLHFNGAILEDDNTGKPEITDSGKVVLKYMQDNDIKLGKAKDIANGLGISSRAVSGALRKLVSDGFAEKVSKDPVVYAITDKGKNYKID
jgi:DNA-binding MarR family transcriptional regulator